MVFPTCRARQGQGFGVFLDQRLFLAGSTDELIKAMISRKRPLALNKGQSSAAAQSFCLHSHICPECHKASCRRRGKAERHTHTYTHPVVEGGEGGRCNYSAVGNNQHNQRPRVQITAVEHTEHHPAPIIPLCIRTQHFIAALRLITPTLH